MNNILLFFTFSLLATLCNAITHDFCVANNQTSPGPEGYACKDPATLTIDDFVYTAFRNSSPLNPMFNSSGTFAYVKQFPALNGLGLSMIRLDLGVGGVVPLHTHRTSEILIVSQGTVVAGFIDSSNYSAYYKKLEVGDMIIFPESLLHFQVNVGATPAVLFATLHDPNPGLQFTSFAVFGSNLPVELVEKTLHLDHEQVLKQKKIFGGS
ncbi:Auxin-binding protein ABP19b [Bienertia sinuspersici]